MEDKEIISTETNLINKEKRREIDLNLLFPGKGYDLNRLFPDEATRKLLYELRRNKRDVEHFIKTLMMEEEEK